MVNSAISKWNKRYQGLAFLILNLRATRKMERIPVKHHGDFTFSGLPQEQIPIVVELYKTLRQGHALDFWKKKLLRYRGGRLCGVVLDSDKKLLGFQLHYFREDEWPKDILYIDYSAMIPEARGKKLASSLRRHTALHFHNQGIKGLSAQTRASNFADVTNLEAVEVFGYKVVDITPGDKGVAKLYIDLPSFLEKHASKIYEDTPMEG